MRIYGDRAGSHIVASICAARKARTGSAGRKGRATKMCRVIGPRTARKRIVESRAWRLARQADDIAAGRSCNRRIRVTVYCAGQCRGDRTRRTPLAITNVVEVAVDVDLNPPNVVDGAGACCAVRIGSGLFRPIDRQATCGVGWWQALKSPIESHRTCARNGSLGLNLLALQTSAECD